MSIFYIGIVTRIQAETRSTSTPSRDSIPGAVVAKTDQLDELLFSVLARVAEQRIGTFNAQELGNIAWAFAKVPFNCVPHHPQPPNPISSLCRFTHSH